MKEIAYLFLAFAIVACTITVKPIVTPKKRIVYRTRHHTVVKTVTPTPPPMPLGELEGLKGHYKVLPSPTLPPEY